MKQAGHSAEARAGWLLTAPALAAIGLFFFVPAIGSLILSFTDFDIYALANPANLRFAGLENYTRLLGNPLFWKAMGNTVWFVVFGVPLLVATSLGAATVSSFFSLGTSADAASASSTNSLRLACIFALCFLPLFFR